VAPDGAPTLADRCHEAGLELAEETSFSRFTIMVAARPADPPVGVD
jgi:hypothetical protein